MPCVSHPIIFNDGLAVGVIVVNMKRVNDSNENIQNLSFKRMNNEHGQRTVDTHSFIFIFLFIDSIGAHQFDLYHSHFQINKLTHTLVV